MGYIEKNLMSGEEIIYRARLHWIIFLPAIVLFLLSFIIMSNDTNVGKFFFFIAILTAIPEFINFMTSEFAVTNKRVLLKVGFIKRHTIELLLKKVESIQVDQGILGRILGYGTVTVVGTGGSRDLFHKISKPLEFRKKSQEQIEYMQA